MATFKVIINYKRSDGTYNIRIRVTHNRRKKILSTQYYLTDADLTRSGKIKPGPHIDAVNDLIKKHRKTCNDVGERLSSMSVEQVIDIINSNYNSSAIFDLDFVAFGRGVAAKMMAEDRKSSSCSYTSALNSLVLFSGRNSISIVEITSKFLQSYIEWLNFHLLQEHKERNSRSVSAYSACIRTLHNMAKLEYNNEDMGIIRIPMSPFAKFKIPPQPQTKKKALSIEQLQALLNSPYHTRSSQEKYRYNLYNLAKDVFVLSFGLVGMNSADLYNCTSYDNEYITYNRTKTAARRADKAEIRIKVEKEIMALFEKYRDKTGERVFCFYQKYSNFSIFNKAINKHLKELGKNIDVENLKFYAARHSWATIARNNAKIDMYTVHTALNHVDEKMKITDIYIKKDDSIIDDANKAVLRLFNFAEFSTQEP